jgi:hypothetical protein
MTCVMFRMRLAPNRNGHGVYQSSHVDRVPSPFGGLKSPAMAGNLGAFVNRKQIGTLRHSDRQVLLTG